MKSVSIDRPQLPASQGAAGKDQRTSSNAIQVGEGNDLVLFLGPCVVESREHAFFMAEAIKKESEAQNFSVVYKSSYLKANRTSKSSFRGPGLEEGLRILSDVRKEFGLPIITDIHTEPEAKIVAEVADVIQIPAFLCRQTSLLEAAGETRKPVLIKKGQFLHPEDMRFAAEKVMGDSQEPRVLLCERGSCFGYRELIVDFRSFGLMRATGHPVVFDATHSVQVMGGAGGKSAGARQWVPPLARAAVAFGIDGLFLECHQAPDSAPSDGPNMIPLSELGSLLKQIRDLRNIVSS